MKPKVVLYHPIRQDLQEKLEAYFELRAFGKVTADTRAAFLEAALEADGLIGMGLPVKTAELREARNLKVIATISTGYDAFDVPELTERKVVLLNLFDPLTESVADLAFALIMATGRRVVELDRKVRAGEWKKSAETPWFGLDIHGKTLGIVGMGRIGGAIARRGALGCGMRILYTARTPKPDVEQKYGAVRRDLDSLLRDSDFVCIVVPLSAETRHLIGERELSLMKPTAILVNVARGAVVDEAALARALESRTIYGAGLDVFETEPLPTTSPLIGMDNVVLAPHIGSATTETRDAMAAYSVDSLIDYLCHGVPRSVVNPEALPLPVSQNAGEGA